MKSFDRKFYLSTKKTLVAEPKTALKMKLFLSKTFPIPFPCAAIGTREFFGKTALILLL